MQINGAPKIKTRPQFDINRCPHHLTFLDVGLNRLTGVRFGKRPHGAPLQCVVVIAPAHYHVREVLKLINDSLPEDATGLDRIEVDQHYPDPYNATMRIYYYGPLQMKGELYDPTPTYRTHTLRDGRRILPRSTVLGSQPSWSTHEKGQRCLNSGLHARVSYTRSRL